MQDEYWRKSSRSGTTGQGACVEVATLDAATPHRD